MWSFFSFRLSPSSLCPKFSADDEQEFPENIITFEESVIVRHYALRGLKSSGRPSVFENITLAPSKELMKEVQEAPVGRPQKSVGFPWLGTVHDIFEGSMFRFYPNRLVCLGI
ncbi:hypothetical protein RRG08_038975 [Elysia crispata]|uniref:Uncharacterized protein n=1 Tax=Elysia crispata TaxID=231223 RepID=A0AAE0Y6V8_9GAST|nr:hypothetical protein RRG08_038975 [Elysia crispata]